MRKTIFGAAVSAVLLALAAPAAAADVDVSQASDASAGLGVNHRYLVTTTHTPEQCLGALDEMAAKKKRTLSKMQWGCRAGDHTGYLIVDTADRETALNMLPESSRAGAKVVELTKFTPRQLRAMHRQQKAAGAAQPAGK